MLQDHTTQMPRWKAYDVLFAAILRLRNPQVSIETLVAEINEDTKNPETPELLGCTYSPRSLIDWRREPKGRRSGIPKGHKVAHLHRWLTKQIAKLGETANFKIHLDAISPPDNEILIPTNKRKKSYFKRKYDWEREDVRHFIKEHILEIIDGAIILYDAPIHHEGKKFWKIEDVVLDSDLPPTTLADVKMYERIITRWDAEHKDEKRGMKYCVHKIIRLTAEGSHKLRLKVSPIEYHLVKPLNDHLSISYDSQENALTGKLESHQFRRTHFLQLFKRDQPAIPNLLTAQITVISKDRRLLLFKRRACESGLDSFRGSWSASIEEGLNADWKPYLKPEEVDTPNSDPDFDFKSCVHRGLSEELGLPKKMILASEFQALAFLLEFCNLNTGVAVIARVPLTAEAIFSKYVSKSGEEFDAYGSCPFDIPSLLPILLDKRRQPKNFHIPGKNPQDFMATWTLHPTARMRIYLSLINEFGFDKVNESLEQGL